MEPTSPRIRKLTGMKACGKLECLCSSIIRVVVHALIYIIPHSLVSPRYTDKILNYPDDVLEVAFQRFKTKVFSERFVPYKFYPRRCQFEPSLDGERVFINKITIEKLLRQPVDAPREVYSIHILEDGTTVLKISTPEGGIRAFDTLAQLFYAHSAVENGIYTNYAPVTITDSPGFGHRGLNLDISRNWIAPQDVLRTIEAMGFNKFNKLHLHATLLKQLFTAVSSSPFLAPKSRRSH